MRNFDAWALLMQGKANNKSSGIECITGGGFIVPLNGTGITINNIAPGDLVIINGASDSQSLIVPNGWEAGYINNGSGTSARGGYFYKFSDGNSISVSGLSGTGTGGYSYGYIYQVFRGVSQTNPINAENGVGSGGDGNPDPPAITTSVDGCMILIMGMLDDDEVANTVNAPSPFTLIYAQEADRYATNMSAYWLQDVAGYINPLAFSSAGADNRIAITVALSPG